MKSSAIGAKYALFDRWRSHRRNTAANPLEHDPGEDQDAAHDLQRMQRLGEQEDREHDREERLQVPEQRRARGPDSVDRGEPEDVGEEERADDGVPEAEPHEPA